MEMATPAVRAAISARAACPALPTRRVGSGRRDSAAATEARAAATDDDESEPESSNAAAIERGHAAIFATATTRRRLAVAVAASLALEPATPRCAAGTLTDLVKNSGVGGGPNLGLAEFDSPDLDYSFQYPRGWKVLRNRLRRGVIVSDFDAPAGNPKVYVEVVSAPPARTSGRSTGRRLIGESKVGHSASRRRHVGGAGGERQQRRRQARGSPDATGERPALQRPRARGHRVDFEPVRLLHVFFRDDDAVGVRRHSAALYGVAKTKGGLVYVLSASATTDGFDETRARLFERIVASFVVN